MATLKEFYIETYTHTLTKILPLTFYCTCFSHFSLLVHPSVHPVVGAFPSKLGRKHLIQRLRLAQSLEGLDELALGPAAGKDAAELTPGSCCL